MSSWMAVMLADMLVPGIMIIAGWMLWRKPPREINGIMGYRTRRSMINQDTWQYANRLCGKVFFRVGLALTALAAGVHLAVHFSGDSDLNRLIGVMTAVEMVVLIASIIPVEVSLRNTFDDNGNRIK